MTLRNRLLASYLLLLALTLSVIAAALLVFLTRQPEPPLSMYKELLGLASNLDRTLLISTFLPLPINDGRDTRLNNFADNYGVRVLVIDLTGEQQRVELDTEQVYAYGSNAPKLENDTLYIIDRRSRQRLPDLNVSFGSFTDADNQEWLFIGLVPLTREKAVIMADVRPDRSLQVALVEFGEALAMPLLQSAVIGLAVALLLAAMISSTIARPLQNLATAANAVAQGDYDHAVPVEGPPEIRAVAETFNQMTDEVRSTHQSQRDFLANVSHDLKTPLTSIQGYSQAIMDGATKDPTHAAAIICDEAARLARMVTELTDLARLQAGATEMQIAPIDVAQIVTSIGQRLNVVAERKQIILNIDTQAVSPVAGDGDRLAQVFTNLMSNAINYTPEAGTIWVRVQGNRGGVEVSVRDTGIGIPANELSRIFERFYQVDKTRGPRRGTGLGLAITREIVQAHGGQVSVMSPGERQGSTFVVWLPMARSVHIQHEPRGTVHG